MKARFLGAARLDLRAAVQYLEAKRPGLGADFRAEVQAAIERIKFLPDAWHLLGDGIRLCRTDRFPYGVIYRSLPDGITIVAVAHLHQVPGHWKGRI